MAWKCCHSFDTVDCVRSRPASLYSQPDHVPALPEIKKAALALLERQQGALALHGLQQAGGTVS